MARFKAEVLARSLEMILGVRRGAAAKEKKLVRALNSLLAKMGYQVVELDGRGPARRARRRGRRGGGRPGRKPARAGKGQAKGRPGRGRKSGRPA